MSEKRSRNLWPALIGLLLGGFVLFCAWAAFQASGLGSEVTDSDYYRKGLEFNAALAEQRQAEVQGWQLQALLNGRSLELQLTDSLGAGVDRATGSLYLATPGTAENLHLPLQEVAPGRYRVEFDPRLAGAVQARLEMQRDGARLQRMLLLNFR